MPNHKICWSSSCWIYYVIVCSFLQYIFWHGLYNVFLLLACLTRSFCDWHKCGFQDLSVFDLSAVHVLLSRFYPILSRFNPDFILNLDVEILSEFYPEFLETQFVHIFPDFILILSWFYPDFILIFQKIWIKFG